MNLDGQVEKIVKADETIALPTVRNYSPTEEENDSSGVNRRKDAELLQN